MPAYQYRGYDTEGSRVEGEIVAQTLDEAERRVQQKSIILVSLQASSKAKGERSDDATARQSIFAAKVSDSDSATILRNLAVMSETGVPLVEGLDAVIQSARTRPIEESLKKIREEIIGGKPLSGAMRGVPQLFPGIVSDLICVAEEGGHLHTALDNAATYLERAADVRKRVSQVMLYPLVMMCVACATTLVMILFVLPKFNDIFKQMHSDVPATTRFLMNVGQVFSTNPIPSAIGGVLAIVAIILCVRIPALRRIFVRLAWKLPVLGDLLRNLALSRSFHSIATMLAGGVPLLQALELGANVAAHDKVRDALVACRNMVEHGTSLSDGLKQSSLFPKVLIQTVSVGERTGRLSQLLSVTARKMEQDADSQLKSAVSLIEPMMIVVMGVIVGSITVSIISPIYSVIEKVK